MENPFENMKPLFIVIFVCMGLAASSQNYHAVQGSPYAGSLGIANNPASMLSAPFKWDVMVIGTQFKASTNIFTIHNYSLLSSPANSQYQINEGYFARKGRMAFNTNLLNTRIALDRKHAIGFGANLRSYADVRSSPYHYIDTMGSSRDFFDINNPLEPLDANITGSSWIELFASYARTLFDTEKMRLNSGVTVKVSRGIAGAFAKLENVRFSRDQDGNILHNASASYGYSSNFDRWQKEKETNENVRDLFSYSDGGMSIDLAFEYYIKTQVVPTWEDDDHFDYNWKIGVSLLDVGLNQFRYGRESRVLTGMRNDISDVELDNKFREVDDFGDVNDSLATIVQSASRPGGKFSIVNPMRLVVNVDRPLANDLYINTELSLNLSPLLKKYHHVREMNLVTVTPRWETRTLGAYLPVQYNAAGKFWIGGAFKAGPLLLGIHNWANLFGKKSMQNGGGYIALVVRAWNITGTKRDRRLNCPE